MLSTYLKKCENMIPSNCLYFFCYVLILWRVEAVGLQDSCTFKHDGSTISRSMVTVHFSVHECKEKASLLEKINVMGFGHLMDCSIRLRGDMCLASPGCTCDSQSLQFSVTRPMDGRQSQQFILVGLLQNGQNFTKTLQIDSFQTSTDSTQAPPEDVESNSSSSDADFTTALTVDGAYRTDTAGTTANLKAGLETESGEPTKSHLSVVVVVSIIGVIIVFAVILPVLFLWRKLQAFSTRSTVSSSVESDQRGNMWHSQAEISNIVYRGSRVSLMITNDIYDESTEARSAVGSADQRPPVPTPAEEEAGAVGGCSPHWVGVSQRPRMPLPPEAFEAGIENAALALPPSRTEAMEETDIYTDIDDIRMERSKNQSQ